MLSGVYGVEASLRITYYILFLINSRDPFDSAQDDRDHQNADT